MFRKMSMNTGDVLLKSDRFINNKSTAVTDSLLGFLCSNPNIGLFDYGKIVVQRDYITTDIVKVISGGASGHEPAHGGFVGKGMLTAAIQGDVSCPPTLTDILKTIKELSYKQESGVLVIVQNNSADCLNFGLAVERARGLGISVKLLVAGDDHSTKSENYAKHGLCGVVLLNKLAGAMAEAGHSIEDIYLFCEMANNNLASVLLLLGSFNLHTEKSCKCTIQNEEMEIGSGLHGEFGLKRLQRLSPPECSQLLYEEMSDFFALNASYSIVVLINNLGNILKMEELIFVKEFVACLQKEKISIARIYHGQFITCICTRGFSVTILKVVDPKILDYLDASCDATAWGKPVSCSIPIDLASCIPCRVSEHRPKMPPGVKLGEEEANIILLAIQFACDALVSCEKQINIIDSESGSGNIGTKMKEGAKALLLELKKKTMTFHYPILFLGNLSIISEKRICGTIGLLYSILFEAAANFFRRYPEDYRIDDRTWFQCLTDSVGVLKSCGKVDFGYGTMYDPLYACSGTISKALEDGYRGLEAFSFGVSAAEDTSQQTRHLSNKYPDAGAHVVSIWMRAVFEGIKMRCD